jgi:hypothetical protein
VRGVLTKVSQGRPQTRMKPWGSFQRHYNLFRMGFRFSWSGRRLSSRFRAFGKRVFVRRRAGWVCGCDDASVGEWESGGDEAVGAEQAADGLPVACVVVFLQAFAYPAQKVVGEDADEPRSREALRQTAFRQPEGCRSREAKASTCDRRRGLRVDGNSAAVRACL